MKHDNLTAERTPGSLHPDGSAIRDSREFIAGIVEMTEGSADIDKRSIIRPGVTIRREAKRILALLDKQSPNADISDRR